MKKFNIILIFQMGRGTKQKKSIEKRSEYNVSEENRESVANKTKYVE